MKQFVSIRAEMSYERANKIILELSHRDFNVDAVAEGKVWIIKGEKENGFVSGAISVSPTVYPQTWIGANDI